MMWHRGPELFQRLAPSQCSLIQSVLVSGLTWLLLTFGFFLLEQLLKFPLCVWRQRYRRPDLSQHFEPRHGPLIQSILSPVTSKPASRGRIKTGHSEVLYSYQVS